MPVAGPPANQSTGAPVPPAGTSSRTGPVSTNTPRPLPPPSAPALSSPAPTSYVALASTKAGLKAWWNHFTFVQRAKKEADEKYKGHATDSGSAGREHTVFGKPLKESLKAASVQISTANSNGELYVWGYIPVVVAKWCVEGTFRVNGSNKRMRDLQAIFEHPPRYGKNVDWKKEQFTTHDVASVFRRYLTQMPESVIPHDMYHLPRNEDEVIATYKRLIRSMPRANQYLLLYVLDLLSVFARKSDKNLMTAKNLAVIFRPALIAHPSHELSPQEHQLSQDVLEFLIKNQDWFMLDIPPPPTMRPSDSAVTVPMTEPSSDLMTSSDEESGGWKLISRDVPKVGRRRTTAEKYAHGHQEDDGNLSPVVESPPSRSNSVVTVTRSRTLPSSKSRIGDEERHAKLVKKQKRASVQPGRTNSSGTTNNG
ncbi:Rho GTPase activation protein [Epithele typhae]|uniref:Rho GTPase activation protein n=1 Tax=Epithele typhae TaxID=378194 RepID=UPI002007DC78|nr:Rho GTPase activation protein [Epithele typhae]KAH9945048.1 Rho GTPase activation protein [Epithele typhae]